MVPSKPKSPDAEIAAEYFGKIIQRKGWQPDEAAAYLEAQRDFALRAVVAELLASGKVTQDEINDGIQRNLAASMKADYQKLTTRPQLAVVKR